MRKNQRPHVSWGTILMLVFTAIVTVFCLSLLRYMSRDTRNQFDSRVLISTWGEKHRTAELSAASPSPQSTIKTTTITIAPTQVIPASKIEDIAVTPIPQDVRSFSMSIGGQVKLDAEISQIVYDESTQTVRYDSVFQELSRSLYSDINIVMLNSSVSAEYKKNPDLSLSQSALQAIKGIGVNYVLVNHGNVMDQGSNGLKQLTNLLDQNGLLYGGVYNRDDAGNIRSFYVNGIQVAVLGYADTVSARTKDLSSREPGLALFDAERVRQDIVLARQSGAKFIIASMYWGKKDAENVTESQRKTAQALCQAGADLLIGFGPDGVLPVEIMETVNGSGNVHQMIAAYSMGTLVSSNRDSRKAVSGMLLHFKVNVDLISGNVSFENIFYTPTYIWKQESNGKTVLKILPSGKPAPDEMIQKQKEIMGRALTLINQTMKDSPAVRRQE